MFRPVGVNVFLYVIRLGFLVLFSDPLYARKILVGEMGHIGLHFDIVPNYTSRFNMVLAVLVIFLTKFAEIGK